MTHLAEGLRPFVKRARGDEALVWGLRAAALGLSWALAVGVFARLRPQPNSLWITVAGATVVLLACWAMWLQRRASPAMVARLVDARLKYHERVATALAVERTEGALVDRLKADAMAHLGIGDPKQVFPLKRHRATAIACAIASFLLAALVAAPNPQDAVLARQEADRSTVKKVAQQIARLKQQAAAKTESPEAKRRELEKALATAEAGLRRTESPREAVAQISTLLDRLAKLHDPAIPGLVAGAADAAGALSANPKTKLFAEHLSQANLKASASDLEELAKTLDNLSPEDKQALAATLTASSQASGNPGMQAAFGKAGSALSSGDSGAASDQISSLSQSLAALAAQQSFEASLGQAQSTAEQAQQQAARQADSGSQGQGQGQGQGGRGAGSGGSTARNQPGDPAERVFVKGKPGAGLNEPLPGPLGPGTSLPLRSFREVLGQFQAFELETLDRGTVPLGDRDLVRRYFSSLH